MKNEDAVCNSRINEKPEDTTEIKYPCGLYQTEMRAKTCRDQDLT